MVKTILRGSIFAGSLFSLCCIITIFSIDAIQSKSKKGSVKSRRPVIWHDPGAVEKLDFVGGAGGRNQAPRPPFTFDEESLSGSNPKVRVIDANGVKWTAKFGPEVSAEIFSTRIAWAAGYFVEPAYFVASGKIEKLGKLERAKKHIKSDGNFANSRFERQRDKGVKSLDGEESWSWVDNPFVGSKELNGLKVIVMLVSNWDNKDVRDIKRGSNTEIFQYPNEDRYLVTDWGASMGKWGGYLGREKWDCNGYAEQTPDFIKGMRDCHLIWGYSGQHTKDFCSDIRPSDVQWLMKYLGRITDDQLRAGLEAGGAKPKEVECFTKAIHQRIDQLRSYLEPGNTAVATCTSKDAP